MRATNGPELPRGWRRLLFRIPILLFRAGLGGLFAGRMVLVEHAGRHTGKRRMVVLEVVDHDRTSGAVTVASGFGPRADWYRNLRAQPHTVIRLRRRRIPVTATPLSAEQAAGVMVAYATAHPRSARGVARLMGFAVDGSDADYAAVGRAVPFLELVPDERAVQ
ncbi:nitroreductase family deazaflavin-dependent oxidoreductase [Pseudosporangium ferrugineum]|uniref:Deazaflavin-dependent oxidoreductase (Nitroreductase family) n=1 Tax=Pseudosporangium ferrugineum TaxID=439699 RepID=A0A2T0RGF1_9ACTN|nr:nitroreductase family deazaflavin-dependent oxidoreductase [Pseudosporangium ferrugineum]PRY20212.1 deazaflavin-dependent oxidoreductase (nitroreductase family) [Pseudosporangium ferrugineum]